MVIPLILFNYITGKFIIHQTNHFYNFDFAISHLYRHFLCSYQLIRLSSMNYEYVTTLVSFNVPFDLNTQKKKKEN